MNRRKFLNTIVLSGFGFTFGSRDVFAEPKKQKNIRGTFSLHENKVSIFTKVPTNPIRIFQMTDTHLSIDDERGVPFRDFSGRMAGAYQKNIHFQSGQEITAKEAFQQTLLLAKDQNVDFLALTGDIFSFPSEAAVEWVFDKLYETGIPFAYIAGNHDWHYEGMKGSSEQLRETWVNKRLKPMYQGKPALYASYDTGGIRFVCIDNSTYEILPEQLDFFRAQVKSGIPFLLLVHIPLYMPGRSMGFGCANPEWGEKTDKNFIIERREKWSKNGHTEVTMKFHEEVFKAENLLLVLAGHTHRQSLDIKNGIPQIVSGHNASGYFMDVNVDSLKKKI
jgi:DNA repair exonuclease SbcCD nuclease subunit